MHTSHTFNICICKVGVSFYDTNQNSISTNSVNYYIIDDYNRNSKRTTKIIDKIGNYLKVSEFDINEVLSYLVYSIIIYSASKLKTYELSKNFIETPKYDLINLYRD